MYLKNMFIGRPNRQNNLLTSRESFELLGPHGSAFHLLFLSLDVLQIFENSHLGTDRLFLHLLQEAALHAHVVRFVAILGSIVSKDLFDVFGIVEIAIVLEGTVVDEVVHLLVILILVALDPPFQWMNGEGSSLDASRWRRQHISRRERT